MAKMTIQEQDRRERQRAWRKEQKNEESSISSKPDPTATQAIKKTMRENK